MMDAIKINCIKKDYLCCPVCGSQELVGIEKENGHCGQCGTLVSVEFVGSVMDNETSEDEFTQISMF